MSLLGFEPRDLLILKDSTSYFRLSNWFHVFYKKYKEQKLNASISERIFILFTYLYSSNSMVTVVIFSVNRWSAMIRNDWYCLLVYIQKSFYFKSLFSLGYCPNFQFVWNIFVPILSKLHQYFTVLFPRDRCDPCHFWTETTLQKTFTLQKKENNISAGIKLFNFDLSDIVHTQFLYAHLSKG